MKKLRNVADREVHFAVRSRHALARGSEFSALAFSAWPFSWFSSWFWEALFVGLRAMWLLIGTSNFVHNDRAGDCKCSRWICLVFLPHNHFGILGSRMDTQHPYGNTGLAKICYRLENSSRMENYLALFSQNSLALQIFFVYPTSGETLYKTQLHRWMTRLKHPPVGSRLANLKWQIWFLLRMIFESYAFGYVHCSPQISSDW